MKRYRKVIYKDGVSCDIHGYSISKRLVSLHYQNPVENVSGFTICDEAGGVIKDCLDFKYRWDVVDHKENVIYYTNDPEYRQTEPLQDLGNIPEQTEPLSNEELTEAVADLIYEVSAAQLGL